MRRSGTAVTLGSWPDGSPEWLEARRSRIGGSDIAAIVHQDRDWQLANPDWLVVDNPHSERHPTSVLGIKFTPNNPGMDT